MKNYKFIKIHFIIDVVCSKHNASSSSWTATQWTHISISISKYIPTTTVPRKTLRMSELTASSVITLRYKWLYSWFTAVSDCGTGNPAVNEPKTERKIEKMKCNRGDKHDIISTRSQLLLPFWAGKQSDTTNQTTCPQSYKTNSQEHEGIWKRH